VRTLLVVSRDPVLALGLAALFEYRGYEGVAAMSAAMALDVVRERRVDIVVVDLALLERRGDVLIAAMAALQSHLAQRTVFMGPPYGFTALESTVADVMASDGARDF
jgi:ActR/RegA family two-component response regulator